MKNQRIFLRRTKYDDLHPDDLFVGNRVNVFSRQLNLIDYGDQYTANKLGSKKERYAWVACVICDMPSVLQLCGSQLYSTMQIIPASVGHNLYYHYFHTICSIKDCFTDLIHPCIFDLATFFNFSPQNSCFDKARCSYQDWRRLGTDLLLQPDCDQSQNDKAYMVRSQPQQ